ncbi:DUF3099 domain-containing protein [Streptomyces sp. NBRC 110035]|uniref:DUF3099 domain-containing protein n=1 Tax=Streptomyces sp. NBRC 110035 TaxID=1547867 RepID=UPI0005A68E14|nr:DUF3099 domain-containing protein [Streptomyces sp. NBRC 110035]
MRKQHGGGVQVFRITGARTGLQEDVRGRQRRYVISMIVRTISVILAATLWNVERHVAIVALVLGMVLPYVAVVIANAGRENSPSLPSAHLTPQARPMITSSRTNDGAAESGTEDVAPGPSPGARTERPEPSWPSGHDHDRP